MVNFTEGENNENTPEKQNILLHINAYNRRFSGEPRPVSHNQGIMFLSTPEAKFELFLLGTPNLQGCLRTFNKLHKYIRLCQSVIFS